MKVFFNASLTGKAEYLSNYEQIRKAIESTDMQLLAAPVFHNEKDKVIKEGKQEVINYYKKLQNWIRQADICVFEVSYPSTSIGHEIAMALHASKPVVAFHVQDAPPNIILESITDDRLQVIDYEVSQLSRLVTDALAYATEQMDTRFNFFISPQIGNYLDWISKYKKLPRAVFLRQLIEEDMKNQGYGG